MDAKMRPSTIILNNWRWRRKDENMDLALIVHKCLKTALATQFGYKTGDVRLMGRGITSQSQWSEWSSVFAYLLTRTF